MSRPLRLALVTPLSGPLADYGCAGATAVRLWTELWAGQGGARLVGNHGGVDPPR